MILSNSSQMGLTMSHSQKIWIIDSGNLSQKSQLGEFLRLILNKKSLNAIALWIVVEESCKKSQTSYIPLKECGGSVWGYWCSFTKIVQRPQSITKHSKKLFCNLKCFSIQQGAHLKKNKMKALKMTALVFYQWIISLRTMIQITTLLRYCGVPQGSILGHCYHFCVNHIVNTSSLLELTLFAGDLLSCCLISIKLWKMTKLKVNIWTMSVLM